METVKRKTINKNISLSRSYQAQPMAWMPLIIFSQIIHS